ncbi:MAG: ATP-binding protein, partial [Bacteriovoracaceae bacterium]|nr:ATP-binding protein [Bacteriovoracaceae bacterium]
MYKRKIKISTNTKDTFFLWGSRQTGKSTLLKQIFSDAIWIDLLKADEFRRYLDHPEYLRTELIGDRENQLVIIDEIQKIPQLLDEVHWLIENRNTVFGLCGSSARKLKRGHANLLGGRAIRYELFGLVSKELGKDFDLDKILNNGYLPRHYQSSRPFNLLRSYVSDYLKEEIAAEGLVRNLPAFSNFLDIASLSDTELVNFSNIARDCGVSSHSIKEYFQILEDTLLGKWLPSYRKRPKRRVINASKFYFSDVGVVNFLAKRKGLEQGSSLYGKAFENWVFHELAAYNAYSENYLDLSYWRLASGIEVDFIIGDMEIAIEAKATKKITFDHLKGLYNLKQDHPDIKKRIIVCLEAKERVTEDGILILPYKSFLRRLWNNFNFVA